MSLYQAPVNDRHPRELAELFANNRKWAQRVSADDPEFFPRLAARQSPSYLWIGCSDSRAPSTQILGLAPGALFSHRNIGNVVAGTDMNCLAVIHFAVEVLEVRHVIVCGHYGCGGVRAALFDQRIGVVDNWLAPIHAVYREHRAWVDGIEDAERRWARLCEINVIEQLTNLCRYSAVEDVWARGQALTVHGCIYGLVDGRLRWLGISVASSDEIEPARHAALEARRAQDSGADAIPDDPGTAPAG